MCLHSRALRPDSSVIISIMLASGYLNCPEKVVTGHLTHSDTYNFHLVGVLFRGGMLAMCIVFRLCILVPTPFPGPFMAVLFAKLENMLQNSIYVNFLLTGLVAQLACHPQPLLRSFLLNTNMVFQPSVKSLLQVCDACMHGCVQAQWWARPTARVTLGGLGTGLVGLGRLVSTWNH